RSVGICGRGSGITVRQEEGDTCYIRCRNNVVTRRAETSTSSVTTRDVVISRGEIYVLLPTHFDRAIFPTCNRLPSYSADRCPRPCETPLRQLKTCARTGISSVVSDIARRYGGSWHIRVHTRIKHTDDCGDLAT